MPVGEPPSRPWSLWLLLIALVGGCGKSPSATDKKIAPGSGGPDRLVHADGLGRRVEVVRRPARIVSLAPSVTEVLYLVGASDRLVGVTIHCDWPTEARKKPKIGDLLNPSAELVLAARPDLVIASTAGNDRSAVLRLGELGLPVFVTAPRTIGGIFETVEQIGRVTGCEAEAAGLVADMRARLDALDRRLSGAPRIRAFFITWFEPLLAPGRGTFENEVLSHAGVDSITSAIPEFYPRYSLEQVLARDPQAILAARHEGNPLPDLKALPGWQQLDAVKQGRILLVAEALQHPSPRFLEALEDLARRLHPERFP